MNIYAILEGAIQTIWKYNFKYILLIICNLFKIWPVIK